MTRLLAAFALATGLWLHGACGAQTPPPPPPTWAELEAAGARIGEVRVLNLDIFDLADPKEDKLLFRWANKLHLQTRAGVIERQLLFKPGDAVSVRVFDENERLLRANRYLYDVQFRPLPRPDGLVDVEVLTRDTWTLDLGASAGRAGGANSSGLHLREYNLLGTGTSVSLGRSNTVDRSGKEFEFSNDRAFGTWTSLRYSYASNSDGRRQAVAVVRPFHVLDARWSAGLTASDDTRIDALYQAGVVASQYRHRQQQREVFGGWSGGLQGGWVRRYLLGLRLNDDRYATEPGLAAPATLPRDERLVQPYMRFDLLEERYEKDLNRNLVGRPEFFALGFASSLQLGRATKGLGSTLDAWLYAGAVSRGFEPAPEHLLMMAATVSGRQVAGQVQRQRVGAQAQYYLPQSRRWMFYASVAADGLKRPDPAEMLLLGGDSGLRGYPLRYQSGTRRALLTVEERFYTDLYVWQLFRIGGAAYFDAGRAWGGDYTNAQNAGWLRNAGVGLRIVSARAAFSNVLHVDLAFPIDGTPDVKKVQLLVKTKTSF